MVLRLCYSIIGLYGVLQTTIDAVPDITNNQVQIFTTCPTLAGQEVEQLVTSPIEKALPIFQILKK